MAWTDLLAAPLRGDHICQVYAAEERLVDAVTVFAGQGVGRGEAVILVTTPAHREAFERRLEADGFAVDYLEQIGQLIFEDAQALLSTLLIDGMPDPGRCRTTVAAAIERARCNGRYPRVRVFGEMVDFLWETNLEATLRLEEIWNELVVAHRITLLCGYSLERGSRASHRFPAALHAAHSHSIHLEEPAVPG